MFGSVCECVLAWVCLSNFKLFNDQLKSCIASMMIWWSHNKTLRLLETRTHFNCMLPIAYPRIYSHAGCIYWLSNNQTILSNLFQNTVYNFFVAPPLYSVPKIVHFEHFICNFLFVYWCCCCRFFILANAFCIIVLRAIAIENAYSLYLAKIQSWM